MHIFSAANFSFFIFIICTVKRAPVSDFEI